MIVYHYTHSPRWKEIKQHGLVQSDQLEGKPAPQDFFTFGLLEPTPENWINNKEFPDIWDSLKGHTGELLLEIKVDPESDHVYVVDRGHYESARQVETGNTDIPSRYRHINLEDGTKAYLESQIPLRDYLQRAEQLQYSLPEIVFREPVSPHRIHVSTVQPLLEDSVSVENWIKGLDEPLRQNPLKERERLARDYLRKIPELRPWFESYQAKLHELQKEGTTDAMLK